MNNTLLYEQLQLICCMIAVGALLFVLMDIVNEIGIQAKWKKHYHIIAEFMTVLLSGFCLCVFLIMRYHGLLRMYVVFALILGAILYARLLRQYCIHVHRLLAKGSLWIYGKTTTILLLPWKMLYRHVFCRAKKYVQKMKQHRQELKENEMDDVDHLEEII